jgi:hypothetical protein
MLLLKDTAHTHALALLALFPAINGAASAAVLKWHCSSQRDKSGCHTLHAASMDSLHQQKPTMFPHSCGFGGPAAVSRIRQQQQQASNVSPPHPLHVQTTSYAPAFPATHRNMQTNSRHDEAAELICKAQACRCLACTASGTDAAQDEPHNTAAPTNQQNTVQPNRLLQHEGIGCLCLRASFKLG